MPEIGKKSWDNGAGSHSFQSNKDKKSLNQIKANESAIEERAKAEVQASLEAAAKGDANALVDMGVRCLKGHWVRKDLEKAVDYFSQAAKKKSPQAMYHLGMCFLKGIGTQRNLSKAFQWFSRGAQRDEKLCVYYTGRCYQNGWGVSPSDSRAKEFFQKARNQKVPEAYCALGEIYLRQARKEDPEFFNHLAEYEFRDGIEQGCINGWAWLGYIWQEGLGKERDLEQAFDCYATGAQLGDPACLRNLGLCCLHGWGTEQNFDRGIHLLRQAARKEDSQACFQLGCAYHRGEWGQTVDYPEAMEWYLKAYETGPHPDACASIGYMYANGQGVPMEKKEAVVWYNRAASLGSAYGWYNLGDAYQHGTGVEVDLEEARNCYERALQAGLKEAKDALAELDRN